MTNKTLAFLPSHYAFELRLIQRGNEYFLRLETEDYTHIEECPLSHATALALQVDLEAWGGLPTPAELEALELAKEKARQETEAERTEQLAASETHKRKRDETLLAQMGITPEVSAEIDRRGGEILRNATADTYPPDRPSFPPAR